MDNDKRKLTEKELNRKNDFEKIIFMRLISESLGVLYLHIALASNR